MPQSYRGGNSRLLSRTLDTALGPTAVLDANGVIVFANAELCDMAKLDATQLVGRQCSWEIAADQSPASSILNALASPASARQGRVAVRQLTTPPVFGSPVTGELFLPLLGPSGDVQLTLVLMGDWEQIRDQVGNFSDHPLARRDAETALLKLRSRWSRLDGLHALAGESPQIRLAMTRAQLAADSECNVIFVGPQDVGLTEISHGIFASRLKRLGSQPIAGTHFPVDCQALDTEGLQNALEVFQARIRPDLHRCSNNLLLLNVQTLPPEGIALVHQWYQLNRGMCSITATAGEGGLAELASCGGEWTHALAWLAEMEICIPQLCQRREDVAVLVHQWLAALGSTTGRPPMRINAEAQDLLEAFSWPGNLLQLRSSIESAAALASVQDCILPAHLPLAIRTFPGSVRSAPSDASEPISLDDVLLDLEREVLRRALAQSPRNRAQVARNLSISRPRLLRRIEQLGLAPDKSNTEPAPPQDDDS